MPAPIPAPLTAPVTAADGPMSRIAAHLDAAVFLAIARAAADDDPLLSAWTDPVTDLLLAEGVFTSRLDGPVIAPTHPDPSTAVRAACIELGRLVPDVDLPFEELNEVTARLGLALVACDAAAAGRPEMFG